MVIGLTGPKLSGKGTAAAYLVAAHGVKSYSLSAPLFDIARLLRLPLTRAHLIAIASGLRDELGKDIIAKALLDDLKHNQHPVQVIDGIRFQEEVTLFSALPDFYLLYIDAPIELRYQRARSRGEKAEEKDMTFEQFEEEEKAETEKGIAALQQHAAHTIVNDGTKEEFYRNIDSIIPLLNGE